MEGRLSKCCRICGDVALGFNFNGLSCESCKAFFRRNALSAKVFKCRKVGNCTISIATRKYCKFCRLQKCYFIGMKRELISVNREDCQRANKQKEKVLKSTEEDDDIVQLETVHLQAYDLERLNECNNAMSVFRDEQKMLQVITENAGSSSEVSVTSVYTLAESFVSKILQFCKSFEAFRSLKLSDHSTILRSFYLEIATICISFAYNPKMDALPVLLNQAESKLSDERKDSCESEKAKMVPILKKFINSMHDALENDTSIRNLILAQLLFSPKRENISCPEFLSYQYWTYCHLLYKFYLHKLQDYQKAEAKFTQVMELLSKINEVTAVFRVYLNEDINKVGQAFVQIYNLFLIKK